LKKGLRDLAPRILDSRLRGDDNRGTFLINYVLYVAIKSFTIKLNCIFFYIRRRGSATADFVV